MRSLVLSVLVLSTSSAFANVPGPSPGVRPMPSDESPRERAVALANQGKIEAAERLLREHLQQKRDDVNSRILLGRILDFDGRPNDAVKVWEEGATGDESDFAIWMAVGEIRLRQGRDGPTISYRRGAMTAQPSKDKGAEGEFKKQHLKLAATAFSKAREFSPMSPEPVRSLAEVYGTLNDHEAAVRAWNELVALEPENADSQFGLGSALNAAGRGDEAAGHFEKATSFNPRLATAHSALAEYYKGKGRDADAAQSRQRAEFFEQLPPFSRISFSEENMHTLQSLENKETVLKLIDDRSDTTTDFLAVLCWTHPHDELEEMSFRALEARGTAALPIVRGLLESAQSSCTIKSSAHILARQKASGLFEYLIRLLPGDIRSAGFDMDIAGTLDELGDPRAVPHLIQVLNPEDQSSPSREVFHDRTMARARASMALGGFDMPESRAALDQGLGHSELSPFCAAALYRQGRDSKHLSAIRAVLHGENTYKALVLADYLNKVKTPEVNQLLEEWEKRRKADAKEKREPQD